MNFSDKKISFLRETQRKLTFFVENQKQIRGRN